MQIIFFNGTRPESNAVVDAISNVYSLIKGNIEVAVLQCIICVCCIKSKSSASLIVIPYFAYKPFIRLICSLGPPIFFPDAIIFSYSITGISLYARG